MIRPEDEAEAVDEEQSGTRHCYYFCVTEGLLVRITLMNSLRDDLRYAFRLLLNSRGFALIAILALAFGIGANTAIFSAVDAVLIRPLPFPEPDRLMTVWEDASFQGLREYARHLPIFSIGKSRTESSWRCRLRAARAPA